MRAYTRELPGLMLEISLLKGAQFAESSFKLLTSISKLKSCELIRPPRDPLPRRYFCKSEFYASGSRSELHSHPRPLAFSSVKIDQRPKPLRVFVHYSLSRPAVYSSRLSSSSPVSRILSILSLVDSDDAEPSSSSCSSCLHRMSHSSPVASYRAASVGMHGRCVYENLLLA